MDIFHDPHDFQVSSNQWREAGETVGFVPTMGALHEGHLRLIDAARRQCDRVSVSIFVNPAQFGPNEDLAAYPRTFEADRAACARRGADAIFAPAPEAMYPPGFQTAIRVEPMSLSLCGHSRPVHFGGVATVCLKLFMLARPTRAYFGWKDAQQLLVLRRMVADLCVPLEIVGVETVREPDGLAMSSRNAYLTPGERAEAPRIHAGLRAAAEAFGAGERDTTKLEAIAREPIEQCPLMRLDYLEARSMDALERLQTAEPGNTLLAAAAFIGKARLIDNVRF